MQCDNGREFDVQSKECVKPGVIRKYMRHSEPMQVSRRDDCNGYLVQKGDKSRCYLCPDHFYFDKASLKCWPIE